MGNQISILGSSSRKTPSKTMYYMGMSALQKYIRRGMPEKGKEAARIVYEYDSSALRRRLRMLALEDIGMANIDLAIDMVEIMMGGGVSFRKYERIVERFSESRKNNNNLSSQFWWEIRTRDVDDPEWKTEGPIPDLPDHPDKNPNEVEFGVDNYVWPVDKKHLNEFWDKTIPMAEEYGGKIERVIKWIKRRNSHFGIHGFLETMAILCRADGPEMPEPSEVVDKTDEVRDVEIVEDEYGVISGVSMDWHTRPGRRIMYMASDRFGVDADDLHLYAFFTEGNEVDQRCHWGNIYRDVIVDAILPYGSDDVSKAMDWMVEHRKWFYQNSYDGD